MTHSHSECEIVLFSAISCTETAIQCTHKQVNCEQYAKYCICKVFTARQH